MRYIRSHLRFEISNFRSKVHGALTSVTLVAKTFLTLVARTSFTTVRVIQYAEHQESSEL